MTQPYQLLDTQLHSIQAEQISEINELAQHQADVYLELALASHYHRLETQKQRIQHGKVFCADCNNPIPTARLAALPNCNRCIDCQTRHEKEN